MHNRIHSRESLGRFIPRRETVESVAVHMIGVPVLAGLLSAICIKGAEQVADIVVDNPNFSSKVVGVCMALGFSAIGAIRISLDSSDESPYEPYFGDSIDLEGFRQSAEEAAEFDRVSDSIWQGIVARLGETGTEGAQAED